MWQVWLLPVLIVGITVALSIPVGRYLAWIFDGRYRAPRWLHWLETRLDTGPQNWKQFCWAFLLFNLVTFLVGFAVLSLQPSLPLNPDQKGMLSPTTIFHSTISFMTNTNQQ